MIHSTFVPSLLFFCARPPYVQIHDNTCEGITARSSIVRVRWSANLVERVGHSDVKLVTRSGKMGSTPDLKYIKRSQNLLQYYFKHDLFVNHQSYREFDVQLRDELDDVLAENSMQTCLHWPTFSSLLTYAVKSHSLNIEDMTPGFGI